MSSLGRGPTAKEAVAELRTYVAEGWKRNRMLSRIRKAAAWVLARRVPLLCGEFDVFRDDGAPALECATWLRDARETLRGAGVGWARWDYAVEFGILQGCAVYTGPLVAERPLDPTLVVAPGLSGA